MDTKQDFSRLSRPLYAMPDFVREAMIEHNLFEAYEDRPPYQQNDYLSWILRAKRDETRQKRLSQMLEELAQGGVYMKMRYTSGVSGKKP